jgi:hypothetical protein
VGEAPVDRRATTDATQGMRPMHQNSPSHTNTIAVAANDTSMRGCLSRKSCLLRKSFILSNRFFLSIIADVQLRSGCSDAIRSF